MLVLLNLAGRAVFDAEAHALKRTGQRGNIASTSAKKQPTRLLPRRAARKHTGGAIAPRPKSQRRDLLVDLLVTVRDFILSLGRGGYAPLVAAPEAPKPAEVGAVLAEATSSTVNDEQRDVLVAAEDVVVDVTGLKLSLAIRAKSRTAVREARRRNPSRRPSKLSRRRRDRLRQEPAPQDAGKARAPARGDRGVPA